MTYEAMNIISRIQWCRHQQLLPSVTQEERAGWRAEEAGLVDALGYRDRTTFVREEYRSHFARYQCGLEDGEALLRLSMLSLRGRSGMEWLRPAYSTTPTQVNRRLSQAPALVHMESRR